MGRSIERNTIRRLISDDERRRTNMLSYGFEEDKEYRCFIKKGFGMFITNTNDFDDFNYLEQMKKMSFYSELLEEGCELVLGPPSPGVVGVICCKNGVYIVNYKDILRKRREKYYRKKEEEEKKQKELIEINIDEIVKNFQRLIDNYRTAVMHSVFGINVLDTAIDSIYKYEKEICEKYIGEYLYKIISSIKVNLTGDDKAKSHIIYVLENKLYDEIFENTVKDTSDKAVSYVKNGLRIIKNYQTIEMHTQMGLNLGKENDYAINDIYDFIDKCNECTLEEKCQIFYGIRKYYIDKNENLPKSAVTIVSSLRTMIFDEKFSNSKEKENSKRIK